MKMATLNDYIFALLNVAKEENVIVTTVKL